MNETLVIQITNQIHSDLTQIQANKLAMVGTTLFIGLFGLYTSPLSLQIGIIIIGLCTLLYQANDLVKALKFNTTNEYLTTKPNLDNSWLGEMYAYLAEQIDKAYVRIDTKKQVKKNQIKLEQLINQRDMLRKYELNQK